MSIGSPRQPHTSHGTSHNNKKKKSLAVMKKTSQRPPVKEPMNFTLLPPIQDMNGGNTRGISLQSPPRRRKKKTKMLASIDRDLA